ncbi:hypothetical protein AB0939_29840 [Streptomyces sp. NPDC006990]|uniref:hypothetical protein n=1 Tax=Streptomyces sp. NPDC006990 TaxID=3154481 RepID=UPI003452DF09
MIALAYLLSVAVAVVVLAVALRRRPAPAPTPPAPAPAEVLPTDAAAEVRQILTAATQLAARLDTAA